MLRLIRPVFNFFSACYGVVSRLLFPLMSRYPLRITFMITTKCNLKCSFCYVKDSLNKSLFSDLSENEWEKVVSSIPPMTSVSFSGGEVFLAPHIFRIIEVLGRKKRLVSIVTNGTTLDDDKIKKLIDSRVTYLMFSLDGLQEMHNKIRGRRDAFQKATENIMKILELKRDLGLMLPLVSIKTVITPENYSGLESFTRFVHEELGVDSIYFSFLVNNPSQKTFVLKDDLENQFFQMGNSYKYPVNQVNQIVDTVATIQHYAQKSGMSVYFSTKNTDSTFLKDYLLNPASFGVRSCDNPWNEFSIYPDGSISSCVTYETGNIRDVDYNVKRVMKVPRYREFLSQMTSWFPYPQSCQGCILRKHERKQ